jgi:hypothetical protein
MPDKELREELIKKLSVPEHICKGEAITFVDWLLDKYYVIKKANTEVVEVQEDKANCPLDPKERLCKLNECRICKLSKVIIVRG